MHALDISHIIDFVYLGLQYKLNYLNSNNSCHTSWIHKGLHAGNWPDIMTSKPDALGYHWTDCTGTTLVDAITHWSSSGNPVLICIIGIHWKTGVTRTLDHHWKNVGRPLETHWLPTILSLVTFKCTLGSKFQAHWIATGLPLNYHWLRVRCEERHSSTESLPLSILQSVNGFRLLHVHNIFVCFYSIYIVFIFVIFLSWDASPTLWWCQNGRLGMTKGCAIVWYSACKKAID